MMWPHMDVNPKYQAASLYDLGQECAARGLLLMWSTICLAHCGLAAPCLFERYQFFARPKPYSLFCFFAVCLPVRPSVEACSFWQ